MPITLPSYVAPNELIQSAWGNSVVNALAEVDAEFVEKAGDTMTGTLIISGDVVRAGTTNGSQFQAVDTDGGNSAYYSFFGAAASISSLGSRTGFVGFLASSTMELRNEVAAGDMIIETPGEMRLVSGSERARLTAGGLLIGKTATGIATTGVELPITGRVFATVSTDDSNIILNKTGSAVVSGAMYQRFDLSGSTIGSITRDAATSAVLYNTTSDARLKTNIGLDASDGLDTIDRVIVRRFVREGGGAESESVGVFAQELVDVIPQAVTRGGDDVDTEPWMVAYGSQDVIGHLVLAVQQLKAQVAELSAP